MLKTLALLIILSFSIHSFSSNNEVEIKKTHLEDIFIWKISDELKLSVQQEKKFTEINRTLNKKKSEINKKIQQAVQGLNAKSSESTLIKYKKLLLDYNQLSISEFDAIKQLLGTKKFISYLKIKNELTTKIKSILISEKSNSDKLETSNKPLPPPKVIIEKNE